MQNKTLDKLPVWNKTQIKIFGHFSTLIQKPFKNHTMQNNNGSIEVRPLPFNIMHNNFKINC